MPMKIYDITKRYFIFIIGLYFLAAGIVLIVRSQLGTTPISSVNYVMSLNTPLSLGTCTFILNCILIAGQFLLIRKNGNRKDVVEIMLQIPFSFVFAAFIDFNMSLTSNLRPGNYFLMVFTLLIGCFIQAIGVVLELKPRVAMMSAEAFVKYTARCFNREFGKTKTYFDITLVLIAILLSLACKGIIEGVREGTVIAACITGYIVTFLNTHIITRDHLSHLLPHHK